MSTTHITYLDHIGTIIRFQNFLSPIGSIRIRNFKTIAFRWHFAQMECQSFRPNKGRSHIPLCGSNSTFQSHHSKQLCSGSLQINCNNFRSHETVNRSLFSLNVYSLLGEWQKQFIIIQSRRNWFGFIGVQIANWLI